MSRRRGVLIAMGLVTTLAVAPHAQPGSTSWDAKFRELPQASNIRASMERMSARPHHVGSPYDKDNAEWLLARFKEWGWDAEIETFSVLFPTPTERVLELLEPTRFTAKLEEPPVAVDPTSNQKSEQLPIYNAYSIDGDVTGPLVYVNYGRPEDYEVLERYGISAEMLVAETIRRLGARIEPVVFCLDQVGALGERLLGEGVPVVAFGRHPGLDLGVSWRMAKEIRARRLHVIHAHQYTPFFYGAIAAQLSRVRPRVIFTEHGRHFPDVVSARRRFANRLVFSRLADRINAVCEFSAHALSEKDGFARDRIEVIQNGVDLPKYGRSPDVPALRARLGLDAGRRYVTMIARFHAVKDHRTLLHAFARVAVAQPDVDLLLVGDGALRTELEHLSADLGLGPRVRFMGVRDDVPDILRASDLFALTSVSEAASLTLLEAMASEMPVVVTAVGGNPEIVRDGIDGLLAPRGDAEAIATAMLRVLDDTSLARSMGRAGAERVRTTYRLERTVARYHELYEGVAESRRAA